MSNDVQSHESVVERLPGEERRASPRHAASTLGSVTARIIGGSPVDLVNFSARGVLFECDSRLLIGARASVRITTTDANLIVSGRVVRSRVKGLVNGALRYDAALALDHELTLRPMLIVSDAAPTVLAHVNGSDDADEDVRFESELDGSFDPAPVAAYLAESEASLAEAGHQDDPETEAIALFEDAARDEVTAAAAEFVAEQGDLHVEVLVHATLEEAPTDAPAIATAADEAAADEPIAFEADAEVAFEAAEEFVFEEVAEPELTPVVEAAVATEAEAFVEMPPDLPAERVWEPEAVNGIAAEPAGESMFETTPPAPAYEAPVSSMFDARPSETWRPAGTSEPPAELAEPVAEVLDVETDVAFEADDTVMFESVFDAAEAGADADVAVTADAEVAAAPAEDVEPAAAASVTAPDEDDRALLPFTSTVPLDLADLRRIAADNQW